MQLFINLTCRPSSIGQMKAYYIAPIPALSGIIHNHDEEHLRFGTALSRFSHSRIIVRLSCPYVSNFWASLYHRLVLQSDRLRVHSISTLIAYNIIMSVCSSDNENIYSRAPLHQHIKINVHRLHIYCLIIVMLMIATISHQGPSLALDDSRVCSDQ